MPWHVLIRAILFKTFKKQESKQHQLRGRGSERERSQDPVAWFDTQVERSQSAVCWSSSNKNREQWGVWIGYRQKIRTEVSINLGSCSPTLFKVFIIMNLTGSCNQSNVMVTFSDGQIHQ